MSYWPDTPVYTHVLRQLFTTSASLVVTILSPADGATLTSGEVPVTWTFSPGTQQTYRLLVIDPDGVTTVYDSGAIASATLGATIPEGFLETGVTGYTIRVDITTTTGGVGTGSVEVDTSFAPSVNVEGLTVTMIGDRCEADVYPELPRVALRWDQVVPSGTETFVRYSVWRALSNPATTAGAWERVASITDVATTSYEYTCPPSFAPVWYAVTWTAIDSNGDSLTSIRQSPAPFATLRFDWTFIHDPANPDSFVAFYTFDVVDAPDEEHSFTRAAGRELPTKFIGQGNGRTVSLEGLPDLQRGEMWSRLYALRAAERTGATLCVRVGRARLRIFAGTDNMRRAVSQQQEQTTVDLVETHYSEAVA